MLVVLSFKLILCIVVNMTCRISGFQDGRSFQLDLLVMLNLRVIKHLFLLSCAIKEYVLEENSTKKVFIQNKIKL
jgi:hypothetical protein